MVETKPTTSFGGNFKTALKYVACSSIWGVQLATGSTVMKCFCFFFVWLPERIMLRKPNLMPVLDIFDRNQNSGPSKLLGPISWTWILDVLFQFSTVGPLPLFIVHTVGALPQDSHQDTNCDLGDFKIQSQSLQPLQPLQATPSQYPWPSVHGVGLDAFFGQWQVQFLRCRGWAKILGFHWLIQTETDKTRRFNYG